MSRHTGGPAAIAARLMWGSLAGPALDDDDRARLALGLGGIVLFERNVGSLDDLRALTAAIRAAAAGPVRISVDQEGGHVVRVAEPLTRFPGPMAIAATGSIRLARAVAAASARELRSIGVDTVLAPVLDVAAVLESAAVGARAFGDRPDVVGRFGAASVRGYLEGGVVPVPKHLPGHGRTLEDSHVAAPRIADDAETLERVDLPPFAAAVAAHAPALMTSHVVYDSLDPDHPASLSSATARLARRRLRFDGVLVTDALVMDAITRRMPLEDAGVLAIRAGMDAAMAIEGQRRVLAGLAAAIGGARIPGARLTEAMRRAGNLERIAVGLPGRPLGQPLRAPVMAWHRRLANEVAARSLTLVADDARLLPLDAATSVLIVDVPAAGRSPIEGPGGATPAATGALATAFPRSTTLRWEQRDAETAAAAVRLAADVEVVILLTRDGFASPETRGLASRLAASAPTIHVALRSPLDLRIPGPGVRIAAYADTLATIDALATALAGQAPFVGRLPVTLDAPAMPTSSARPPVPSTGLMGSPA